MTESVESVWAIAIPFDSETGGLPWIAAHMRFANEQREAAETVRRTSNEQVRPCQ